MMPIRSSSLRRAVRFASLFSLIVLATLVLATADAQPLQDRSGGLTLHEWGTFTVVAGADGIASRWRPLDVPSDLPAFVEMRTRNGKSEILGTVRMETPVIYLYSEIETKVSIAVDFPAGQITEWYPAAQVPYQGRTIEWNNVRVLPGSEPRYPQGGELSHYYAARDTDSAPLVVLDKDGKTQSEKLLFYRGVGTFELPIRSNTDAKSVSLKVTYAGLTRAIVVECLGGRVGHVEADLTSGAVTVTRPLPVDGGAEALRAVLLAQLEAAGLYPKEASAMLATWGDTWTEDGLRVFFVVPRATTDALLPLRADPAPVAIERVLLGRIEIVTPEVESAVGKLALDLKGPIEGLADARRKLETLGHFREPILRIVSARNRGPISEALRGAFPDVFRDF